MVTAVARSFINLSMSSHIALDSDDIIIAVPIARAILSVLAPFGGG